MQPTQGGTVSGVLRTTDGKPAPGVRVAAIPQTNSADEAPAGGTLSSIAETDEQGRYTLENIPPGRYYITAGRLDLPTFYPGTQTMTAGEPVRIAAGATVPGIDFILNATSAGRAAVLPIGATFSIPLEVRVDNGGRIPVSSGGKFTTVQLSDAAGGTVGSAKLNEPMISLLPGVQAYRVTVEGLPDGYTVKSIQYGQTNLPDRLLRISTPNTSGNTLQTVFSTSLFSVGTTAFGASLAPAQTLSILLDNTAALPARIRARVTGNIRGKPTRLLYLSGAPGTVFADGTFEFLNVAPGRHVIVTLDNPPSTAALAASAVVGTQDLGGVEVVTTPALPRNMRTLIAPGPAGTRAVGPLPLASLRGRVLDSETGIPLTAGTVWLVGDSWAPYELGADGGYQFQGLLPGNYELEVRGVGYPTFGRSIVIDEQDLELELKAN